MISLAPATPAPSEEHLDHLSALVRLLADPKAAAARIEELRAAAKSATDAIAEARQIQDAAKAARETAGRDIEAAKAKHKAAIDGERATFEAEIRTGRQALLARENELNRREEYVEKTTKEAEALRADLQRRRDAVIAAISTD